MKHKLAIVQAVYYEDIASEMWSGAMTEIHNHNDKIIGNVEDFFVSGIFEIPVIISKNIKKFDAFIALGCVIKGETPHFEFISKTPGTLIILYLTLEVLLMSRVNCAATSRLEDISR